jgi:SAM-dependent methyltransferase
MNNIVNVYPVHMTMDHLGKVEEIVLKRSSQDNRCKVLNISNVEIDEKIANIVNFDISTMFDVGGYEITVPFDKDEFDICICINTLERTMEFQKIVDGIKEVLKPGGLLYIEATLLEPFLSHERDIIRITPLGMIKLLDGFIVEEIDIVNGPGSTAHWISRIYHALTFDRNGTVNDLLSKSVDSNYAEAYNILGMVFQNTKSTDDDLNFKEHSITIASSYYVVAIKK